MKYKESSNNEYFSNYDKERLSKILIKARSQSGLSQESMALKLGVAKRTIQNWEKGTSAPTLPQAIELFRIMNVPAMPYFLEFIFPDFENVNSNCEDEELRIQLIKLIETLPSEGIRQLMYIFYGDHGSSPRGILNMVTAHLQTPMQNRYNHGSTILNNYYLAKDSNQLTDVNHIQPNTTLLENAIDNGRNAILNGKNSYTLLK